MKKGMIPLLFLLLFLFGCKPSSLYGGVKITNLIIEEYAGDKHSVSFMVDNTNTFATDCYAKIVLDEQTKFYDLGIVPAKTKKTKELTLSFKSGDTQIRIEPVCKEVDGSIVEKCGGVEDPIDRLVCGSIKEKPALQQCVTRKTSQEKVFCAALLSNDAQLCYYILNPQKYWCLAYITGDNSLCEKIESLERKDLCYMDIGMNKRDESLCKKIKDETKKITCEASLNLDADMCLRGDERSMLACIANIAEFTGNEQLCEKLTDLKEECYSWLGK